MCIRDSGNEKKLSRFLVTIQALVNVNFISSKVIPIWAGSGISVPAGHTELKPLMTAVAGSRQTTV